MLVECRFTIYLSFTTLECADQDINENFHAIEETLFIL